MSHACPICRVPLPEAERYPRYVCNSCAERATSADGRSLEFANIDMSGGYQARYAHTSAPHDRHDCWIDGIACRADEARFGGIVIECKEQRMAAAGSAVNARRGSAE